MTCWVKLPTPALPGSGSRRPETAVCFDLSRGCPSAPLFLCPNLLYTPTADCQAFQILSTRFPPGFTRFLQCSFICTGYTAAVLKKQPDRSDRYEEKAYSLRGCEILKPSPRGKVAPQGRMRGKLPIANRKRAAMASSALISHLTVTASVSAPRAAFGGCAPTRACGRSPSGEAKKRTPNRVPAFLSVKIYLLILIRSAPGSTAPEATTSTSLKSSVFVTTVITTAG